MLFVEHRKSAEKYWWIAGILLVILKCIEPGNMNIKGHIAGFLMAYMLYGIGTYLMKINIINKVMKFIGGDRYFGCCFKTGMQNNHVFRKSTKEKYCLIKMYDKI